MRGLNALGGPAINPITGQTTAFVYSGDPVSGSGWVSSDHRDCKWLMSSGPVTLADADSLEIAIAIIIAQGMNPLESVTLLKQNAILAQQYYDSNYTIPVVSVSDNSSLIPEDVELKQNYPNPFNPATTIEYSLSTSRFVTLKIFDLNGKEIETLVKKNQILGDHKVFWQPVKLASGIYFYRLEVNGFSETRKLLFLK